MVRENRKAFTSIMHAKMTMKEKECKVNYIICSKVFAFQLLMLETKVKGKSQGLNSYSGFSIIKQHYKC